MIANEKNERGLNDFYNKILTLQKETGIPVVIIILGTDPHYLPVARKIKELAVPYGLPVIDTVTVFKDERRDAFCVHRLNCHPNAAAHRILARLLLSSLKNLGYLNEK